MTKQINERIWDALLVPLSAAVGIAVYVALSRFVHVHEWTIDCLAFVATIATHHGGSR